jgi:hypothetical protein
MNSVGKAIKTNNNYIFEKEFFQQGHIYKYLGDLDLIDDNYPIYQSEYQEEEEYETKETLKKLCKGTRVDWLFLFDMLDWACAESVFLELEDNEWFFGDNE